LREVLPSEQVPERAVYPLCLLLHVEEQLDAVADPHRLAKVRFVGVNAQDMQDDVVLQALLGGGVVQARVEAVVGCPVAVQQLAGRRRIFGRCVIELLLLEHRFRQDRGLRRRHVGCPLRPLGQ
jgi:hypothetical protein